MPSHTPAERRKRIREKLLKETLERQKKLEAQLGVAGVVRPPSVVSPRPLRVGPVPTASPRPIAPVSAVAPPRTPATPVRQPVPGEQERVFGLAQFGSISNQLNEIKRLEEAGTGRGTITEILGEKGLSATQASTLLGIRDREISGQITERRTPPPFEPFTRASNILDITGSLAASRFLPQVRELAEKHREEGRSTVTAARLALEEADLPPGVKILFRAMEPSILLPGVGIGGRLLRGALAPSGKSVVTQFLKKQAGERAEQLSAAARLPTMAERVRAVKPWEAFAQPTVSQRLGVAPAPGLPVPPRTLERRAAPAAAAAGREVATPSRLSQSGRFRIFDVTHPEAELIALESGGAEAALGGVRRFQIFDEASQAPLITVAAKLFPAGRDVFEAEVRGLDLKGRPLSFDDPTMRGTFSLHDVAEIAKGVMDELGADTLVGFRIGTRAPLDITRQQVDDILRRTVDVPTPTAARPDAPVTAAAREVTELGRLKGQLTEVETALDDILSDVEYTTRFPGTEPRPYSVRYPGHQPGTPGYRPPTKKPTAYTAEEKAYIAAADKFDAEYPKGLRASIQRAQKEIDALEARQVPDAPVTTTARQVADLPTTARAADVAPAARTAVGPTDVPAPAARGLFQNIRLNDLNAQELARFLSEKVEPAFIEKFGNAPVMAFRRQGFPAGEPLLAISTGGWHDRALAMGLEHVRDEPFQKLYRLPGAMREAVPTRAPTLALPTTAPVTPAPTTARVAGLPEGAVEIPNTPEIQRIGNVATVEAGQLRAVHVTSDPSRLEEVLRVGGDISQTRDPGLVGDLGTSGIYFSNAPQLWTGRAAAKWNFLRELSPAQRTSLSESLEQEIRRLRGTRYITESEEETALRYIREFKKRPDFTGGVVQIADQPYNVGFWKPEFLSRIGVEQARPPVEVPIVLRGRFADISGVPSTRRTDVVAALKEQGFDGALVRGHMMGDTPQGVVWNREAIEQFGEIRPARRAPVTTTATRVADLPTTARKRTVEELLEAGGYEAPPLAEPDMARFVRDAEYQKLWEKTWAELVPERRAAMHRGIAKIGLFEGQAAPINAPIKGRSGYSYRGADTVEELLGAERSYQTGGRPFQWGGAFEIEFKGRPGTPIISPITGQPHHPGAMIGDIDPNTVTRVFVDPEAFVSAGIDPSDITKLKRTFPRADIIEAVVSPDDPEDLRIATRLLQEVTGARPAGLTPDEVTEAAGREAAGAVPPTGAPGPAGVGVERLASITPEQPTVASLGRKLDDLEIRVMELDAEIEVAGAGSLVRPKWAVGLTNPQVEEIARHENLNPFLPDWGDAVDSQFIASVKREGTFKWIRSDTSLIRQERAALNRDRPLIEAQLAELRIADAITKRTAEVTQRLTPSGGAIPPSGVGMPIGGRAVPTTGAYLPTLPTIEEVLAVNFKEDWVRTLGQRLARLPIVRKIFTEQVNPTVLAMDTPHKGIIAYLAIRDAADSAAIAGMKYIDELRHAFKVDRLGRVTNVQVPRGASADIGDVLTLPGAYPLNAVQREYARRVKALLTKNLDSQRQRGVKIKPITNFDEAARKISIDVDVGQGRYFPRVVIKRVVEGEEVEIGRGPIRGAIGAKQAQAKPRSWPTQRQGREQGGNIYLADPTETMRITLMAGRRAEADAILADFIRKQPGVATVVERLKARWPDVVLERELSLAAERNRTFALKLLRRVVRGETPALQSMAKLRRDFPSMTEAVEQATGVRQAAQPALGEMRPTFRAPGGVVTERARRRILDRHITALLELENPSRRRMAEAKTQYTQKKLGVLADPATEEQLFQPAFQGLIMPKEMAEQITTHLTDRGPKLLESINDFNDVLRMLETGLDPGFLFIQGAITLLYRPIVWGKTTAITFRSLINPAVADAYFQLPATRATIDKMVQFAATPLSSSEFVAAASRGRLSRAPVVGGIFRGGAAAFNTFLDVARIEMHKSLGVMAKDDDAYRQLTTTIDQMFGVLSSRQLGVTPTRRALEGSLLMYAPRYRRAGAALMLSIFRGGLRGKIARQALSHFIFGSMAFMSGLAIALGQSDRLDPRKGRNGIPRMYDIRYGDFLSVKIGGSIIGVGGVTVSYLRLLGNLSRGLSDDGVKGVALTAFRSLRGLTSPFSSDVIDLVTGKAGYTEEDTRTPAGLAKMAASDILPFYVEPFVTSAIEELEGVKRQDVGIETFIFNLIGTRERGISPFEQRMMAREQWSINSGLTTLEGEVVREWTDMNRFQQKEAERQEPKLAQLIEEIDDLNYRRADRNTRVRLDVVREEREDFEAEMTGVAESLIRGVPDATRRWYDKERIRIRAEHRGATNVLWAIRALGDAGSVEALQKWILENQQLEDAVSDLYFENREKMQDAIPVLTSLDWDRIDAELDKWLLQTYGSAIRDYVLAHKDDWILSMPEEVRVVELQRQREIESGMWFRFYNLPPIIRQAPTGPAPTTPAPIPSSRQPSGLGRPPALVP